MKYFFTLLLSFIFIHHSTTLARETPNIILMIGDGMGISAITAAQIQSKKLHLEEFQHIGLVKTSSSNHLITDSAASATAMATGYKTKNKFVGLDPDGKKLKTILEIAQSQEMKTGLISTSSITHATPAAFISHVKSRYLHHEIASQIIENPADVLIGGGLNYFSKNLLSQLPSNYKMITDPKKFKKLKTPSHLLALLAPDGLPQVKDRKISLKNMAKKSLEILSKSKNGFFLMIEGAQIDWMGHDNLGPELIDEMIDFDEAIGEVLKFSKINPHTLIIVTADHETGGFGITKTSDKKIKSYGFLSKHHTPQLVPLFAHGPYADEFTGFIDNTDIGKKLIQIISSK